MDHQEIKKVLNELTADIDAIADKKAVTVINVLVNLIEVLAEKNVTITEENRKLRDEVNRLKGEQGKPNIRGQSKGGNNDNSGNSNYSSEEDRKKHGRKSKNKGKRKKNLHIDRRITVTLDKEKLPNDAKFKGFEMRIIQDLKIITDNVEIKLEVYYSPSLKKTFIASMPTEYQEGEFGPGVKALAITLYRDAGMTELAIERFLKACGLQISHGKISAILIEDHDVFHQEKENIVDAGIKAGLCQQMDDTSSRVNGKNHYTHILCNNFFTSYFTRHQKDRLTLLELLCRDQLKFILNQDAYNLMIELNLAKKWHEKIRLLLQPNPLTHKEINSLLTTLSPDFEKHSTNRRIILESAALTYYQKSEYFIQYLMTDDAPQFNKLALHHALCWIHEGRHYKKLNPFSSVNQKILDVFLEQFWDYYHALLMYKGTPSQTMAQQLLIQFDTLFETTTDYQALNQRIAMTRAKKEALLLVLAKPFLPLHNNASELGARVQARMRDINYQTVSQNGTQSKDTFATIAQTAKKLGVNFYKYVYDRVAKKFEMPSLAELIFLKAREVQSST